MLELVKITKDYKVADQTTTVLKGISLTFRNHEFISILGQSGCGKTTMLNIIGGLDKFTTGDLIINGKSTKKYKDHDWDTYRNHSIGFVFQSYNLIPHQSVLKNVELALSIGGISKSERRKRAIDALVKVGLEDHIKKRPNQLSGGQCQRVSIARALVGNPDIILADEPTGALDTETSVQIMEILKEISKERLVIMVTHNPELAERYSTRIVRMLDGNIISDSMPVNDEEKESLLEEVKAKDSLLTEKEKKRAERKSSMSLFTSFALSASNLWTKKSRTFITSLACSIGIIGIAVVLSVSTGMHEYVNILEQDSASANYIMINNTKMQIPTAESFEGLEVTLEEYPKNSTGIYPYKETKIEDILKPEKQILSEDYINYIESNINGESADKNLVLGIQYSRSTNINVFIYKDNLYNSSSTYSWSEIIDNQSYIESQYTPLAKLNDYTIPTSYNEVVLVVDTYNRLSTDILDQLGIAYSEDLKEIKFQEILGKEIKLILNNDYYKETLDAKTGRTIYKPIETQEDMKQAYENGVTLKIVSIVRPNEDVSNSWISTGIGYTTALTDYIIEQNKESDVVKFQTENETYDVLTGRDFSTGPSIFPMFSSSTYEENMKKLGAVTTPDSLVIYPHDFEAKDKIIQVLKNWNNSEIYKLYGNEKDEEGKFLADQYKVEFIDISELLASMLGDLIDIITYALIAFSAISLVVSSIMIAIITYASVIERIKEIGTLRSLGARKKDISAVFIAEAGIIGAVSAVIALLATIIINIIINIVLGRLVGVSTIAQLSLSISFWMIVLCISINLIASLVPAIMAAKKDPVVALRTE